MSVLRLSDDEARGLVCRSQCLPRSASSLSEALEHGGYVRTLGGIDVYLALRVRVPELARVGVDAAPQSQRIQVVPSVRGCMYLVPRSEVAWSLRLADRLSKRSRERDHEKVELSPGELESVGDRVLETLSDRGPLTTNPLRRALPEGTVRSFGDILFLRCRHGHSRRLRQLGRDRQACRSFGDGAPRPDGSRDRRSRWRPSLRDDLASRGGPGSLTRSWYHEIEVPIWGAASRQRSGRCGT